MPVLINASDLGIFGTQIIMQRQLIIYACLVNGNIARIRYGHEKRHTNDLTGSTTSIHVVYHITMIYGFK